MAIDRNKVQQNAEKLVRQGKIDQAIGLYEELLEDNPRDMNLKIKVGDLLIRAGNVPGAVKVFNQVASFYGEEGFYLKAIAIYKRINKLDPAAVSCYFKLAELYSKQGLNNDAKTQYQQVADLYVKEGDLAKAAEALDQLLKLEPDNVKIRMRLAEIYGRLGQTAKAVNEYQAFGDELVKKSLNADAVKIYEKGLAIDGGHPGLVAGLMKALFDLGQMEQLIQRGRELFAKNSENVPMLSLLAAAYERTGQGAQARQAYERLAGLEPGNSAWKERLAAGQSAQAAAARPSARPSARPAVGIPDFSEMTGDYSMEELTEVSGEWGPDEGTAAAAGDGGAVVDSERGEFILEHTTEAEVFIKYGLIEKAIDNLEAIVNHYPDEVDSLRRLKDLYLETGNKARAAEKCADLARIARQKGEIDRASELIAEARAHDPAVRIERPAAAAAAEAEQPEFGFGGGAAPVELEGGPPPSGVEIDFGAPVGETVGGGGAGEAIEFQLDEGGTEEPAGIDFDVDEPAARAGGAGGVVLFENAFRAPSRDAGGGAEESDSSLFEAESGFLAGAGEVEPAAASAGKGLSEDSLDEILKDFKKGVDAQVDSEDYETHYNLGIAYREMGLVDEAVAEFQLASKDPNRFIECCSSLGLCFREKGMPKLALKWYQKALDGLDPESPQYIALKYDLGEAYEESGDKEKSLEQFIDVLGLDAGYRDVQEKITKLEEGA